MWEVFPQASLARPHIPPPSLLFPWLEGFGFSSFWSSLLVFFLKTRCGMGQGPQLSPFMESVMVKPGGKPYRQARAGQTLHVGKLQGSTVAE